jgi:hypothetical protein
MVKEPYKMESQKSMKTKTNNLPLFSVFLIFLVLKLCNVINWSWWWVTSPLWIPLVIVVPIWLIFGFIAIAGFLFVMAGIWAKK